MGLLAAPIKFWTSANQLPKSVARPAVAPFGPFLLAPESEKALEGFHLDHVYQGEGSNPRSRGGLLSRSRVLNCAVVQNDLLILNNCTLLSTLLL